ncbi:AAA family ATPase, partial [Acinetobacter baumannii]
TKTEEFIDFSKKFNDVFNSHSSELRKKISKIENRLNSIFTNQFGSASLNFQFDFPKIESFFKGSSIHINDGIEVRMDEKGNGMQRSVALALLQIYAEEIAFDQDKQSTRPFYLFIDEPEICLHPMGQMKLCEALMELSKHKQIFVTTHSPYFLNSPSLKNVGIFIFKKEDHKNIISKANMDYLFPWSPTWGEINYKAYNLPTVDLHNELYGYLQEKSQSYSENTFESWLNSQGCPTSKTWIRDRNGTALPPKSVTLMTFIRNHIH